MRFTKIRVTDKGVELNWTIQHANGTTIEQHLKSAEKPAPQLPAALKAFVDYVAELLDLPDGWRETLEVRQLAINEEAETGLRGLIVTATRKIGKAHNRPLLINTPYLREPNDQDAGEGFLDEETLALIGTAEEHATAFVKGEREQLSLVPESAEDPTVQPAATPAPPAPPKPKRRAKGKGVKTGDGYLPVANPNVGAPLTDERLRDVLLDAERDVPLELVANWTATEREQAYAWARAEKLKYSGGPAHALVEPEHVKRAATPSLRDGWTMPKPKKFTADDEQEIKAALEAGD